MAELVEAGQVHVAGHVGGQHAAVRVEQPDVDAGQPPDGAQDAVQVLLDRDHDECFSAPET